MSKRLFYPNIAAGQEIQVNIPGTFLRCTRATGGDISVLFADINVEFPLPSGTAFEPVNRFSEFRLRNNTGGAISDLEIYVVDGRFFDDRLNFGGGLLSVNTIGASLDTLNDAGSPLVVGAGANVQAAGANASRQFLIIRNVGGSSLFVREDAVLQESAIEIPALGVVSLEATNAVRLYNPGGAAVNAYVSELG
jgi:hypothetical protein